MLLLQNIFMFLKLISSLETKLFFFFHFAFYFNFSITNSLNKVNSMFGQLHQGGINPGAAKIDYNLQNVACPECHLEFPGIDLLQAHISVSHKHLDVKLPNTNNSEEAPNGGNNTGDESNRPSWHTTWENSLELYKCTVCNKGFQKMSKLTAHMKIHRYIFIY